MERQVEMTQAAHFFDLAITQIAGLRDKKSVRVLDFGCGEGGLINALVDRGYDAIGCDIALYGDGQTNSRVHKIADAPYRLPCRDESIDIVVSTCVLEHARNPHEYMSEIRRVLKPGGHAMHLMPARYYLPTEPHLRVPMANFFWPNCPTWWFAMWAILQFRGPYPKYLKWREMVALCRKFYDNEVIYMPTRQYNDLSRQYFSAHSWPMAFYIKNSYGGFASLAKLFPLPRLWGYLSREYRMAFLVQRK